MTPTLPQQDNSLEPTASDHSVEPALVDERSTPSKLTSIGLAALVFMLYATSLQFDFVNWDDPSYVLNNETIKSWSFANLHSIATKVAIKNYAPLTMFSLLIDYTLWGENAGGYHLTNILLHALNAVLVYWLVTQVTRQRFIGWTTAVLFAVHPVQVESVVWISSRKGLLSGAFMLAALICWLRPKRTPKQELWGILFLAGALLAKALAVVIPAIMLTYDILVNRKKFAEALARQIIPGLMCLLLLMVTMSAQMTEMGGIRTHMSLSRWYLMALDTTILWKYVGMMLYPHDLCVLYDVPLKDVWGQICLSTIGIAIVAYVGYRLRHSKPLIPWATLSFLLLLLPVLNLFPISTLMNDRYLYMPSIAFFAVMMGSFQACDRWLRRRLGLDQSSKNIQTIHRIVQAVVLVVVLNIYVMETNRYLPVWRNGMTLWSYAHKQVPTLTVVKIQWANTLHHAGEDDRARVILEEALATTNPDDADRKRIIQKLRDW